MLEHLFGSRTRVKLLILFVHNPDDGFFVRELTRRIDTQINAVRREIQNLVKIGMLIEISAPQEDVPVKRPGLKRKYYKANKEFPLYRELHSLLTKAHIFLENKFDDRVKKLGSVSYLAFMGSFQGIPNQPVDLFLVGTVNEVEFKKLVQELEAQLGFEINYTCMTLQEFTYRKEIADRFLDSIMLAPKTVAVNKLEGPAAR
ncbi:MAG: hypothetical protein WA001_00500 [Patescibacteria group bacterium]